MQTVDVLVARLRPLFNGEVYASTFPEFGAPLPVPMCRYTITGVAPFANACGDSDDLESDEDSDSEDETAEFSFQLDVIAQDFDACVALRKLTRRALKGMDPPVICTLWQQLFDTETKVHRAVLNYTAHASSAT